MVLGLKLSALVAANTGEVITQVASSHQIATVAVIYTPELSADF